MNLKVAAKAAMASVMSIIEREATFKAGHQKARRGSRGSKKAAQPVSWPHELPRPSDLAFAGFVFKPTVFAPDNVQCVICHCQLDSWEPGDVPAHEHLTNSPTCGLAINVCIRIRDGDANRVEEDPMAHWLQEARRATFKQKWPLDAGAGYPGVDQMVAAGWYYDPTPDGCDGVTCPYCSLSLDSWDIGDDPSEEHRRRCPDCLFFSLKELYHPSDPIPKIATQQKATRGKRASRASSTSSITKKAPARSKAQGKGTKSKKAPSVDVDPQPESRPEPAEISSSPAAALEPSLIKEVPTKVTRTKAALKPSSTEEVPTKTTRTKAAPSTKAQTKTRKGSKRISTISTISTSTRQTRGTKRTSDDLDNPVPQSMGSRRAKRSKPNSEALGNDERFSLSSLKPGSYLESTPPTAFFTRKEMDQAQIADATTPKAHTPKVRTPEAKTPERIPLASKWSPIDIDMFFDQKSDAVGLVSDVMVDGGLDKENIDVEMKDVRALAEVVKVKLTAEEKEMTIEQWVMYNAKRGEEKLRSECERQLAAFDAEGRRALMALETVRVN
ncbi:inhibitor of apoptosis repeat-containing protein [Lojkania enalia]|uniref:Inhibitor of apoptosis repeat-containing protein n=1 Tax=Lojkania enalia TaxID=147567 RepID=A0A9P4K3J5_9PLEO|nr:inhibitor of apoptosis repeat-containing protein [Didymosphaeria enalia]